ncbi:MAG: hypothetical protein ACK5Q1_17095 [Limnobacter sp.]
MAIMPIGWHAVATIKLPFVHGILNAKSFYYAVGGVHIDAQLPPDMSFTFLAKSWANSLKISLVGQVL